MTWTYTNSPSTVTLDAVRVLIGDIDTNDQLITDEVINFYLSEEGNDTYRAAALCCDALVADFSKAVDRTLGSLSVRASQRASHYRALGELLRKRAQGSSAKPYFGGLSDSELEADEDDTDLLMPTFKRDMMKYE